MSENNVLYENAFVPGEKDIDDYVAHQLKKRTPRTVLGTVAIIVLMFALWFWLSSLGIIFNQFVHFLFAAIMLIAVMAADAYLKHSDFRRLVKKFTRQNKDDLAGIKTLFYEDRIESNGKTYSYQDFSSVLYGESCMFLVSAKGAVLMIKDTAAAFNNAESEPFWNFLNSKCPIKKPGQEKPRRWYLKFRSHL
ncbi:MAG: hypothetical protein FWG66_02305 [Spirochaetes bacterium]|nr:hypothetical protein [Spirochaetota bacterium]